jgi:glutamate-1-semialdehyde 2,1-aminomutase
VSAELAERIAAEEDADYEDTCGVGGTRAEYRFAAEPPRTGAESAGAADREVEEYLHLYLLNRGVLITPFHNMALMCPVTTEEQVDRHTEAFTAAVEELAP